MASYQTALPQAPKLPRRRDGREQPLARDQFHPVQDLLIRGEMLRRVSLHTANIAFAETIDFIADRAEGPARL